MPKDDLVLRSKPRLIGRIRSLSWRLAKPWLSLRRHWQTLGPTLFCPVYHIVRENHPEWWGGRYRIKTPSEFERDLDVLLNLAEPVDLHQLLAWRRGLAKKPNGWFLSFDDGYRELYDVVAPILLRKGVPATFFLCSSMIDNRAPFFEDVLGLIAHEVSHCSLTVRHEAERVLAQHGTNLTLFLQSRIPQFELLSLVTRILEMDIEAWLKRDYPYVTGIQMESLLSQGFTVGAHSVDHPLFEQLRPAEQQRQIHVSVDAITKRFHLDYRVFAFPYGEFGLTRRFLTGVLEDGIVDLCFGTRGITIDELEPGLIQRTLCEGHKDTIESHLKNELNLQLRRRCQGRAVVRRNEP